MYGILAFMKKASIVYFIIGCICLLLVPVMAFIFLPVAFVYLIPAAIFFWLSKDLIITTSKKVIKKLSEHTGLFLNKANGKKINAITGTNATHTQPIIKYTRFAFFMIASITYKKEKCYRNFASFCFKFHIDFYA